MTTALVGTRNKLPSIRTLAIIGVAALMVVALWISTNDAHAGELGPHNIPVVGAHVRAQSPVQVIDPPVPVLDTAGFDLPLLGPRAPLTLVQTDPQRFSNSLVVGGSFRAEL